MSGARGYVLVMAPTVADAPERETAVDGATGSGPLCWPNGRADRLRSRGGHRSSRVRFQGGRSADPPDRAARTHLNCSRSHPSRIDGRLRPLPGRRPAKGRAGRSPRGRARYRRPNRRRLLCLPPPKNHDGSGSPAPCTASSSPPPVCSSTADQHLRRRGRGPRDSPPGAAAVGLGPPARWQASQAIDRLLRPRTQAAVPAEPRSPSRKSPFRTRRSETSVTSTVSPSS